MEHKDLVLICAALLVDNFGDDKFDRVYNACLTALNNNDDLLFKDANMTNAEKCLNRLQIVHEMNLESNLRSLEYFILRRVREAVLKYSNKTNTYFSDNSYKHLGGYALKPEYSIFIEKSESCVTVSLCKNNEILLKLNRKFPLQFTDYDILKNNSVLIEILTKHNDIFK